MFLSIVIACWVVALVAQLYYWLMVVWPLASHHGRTRPAIEPVSVIICAHGSTPQLPDLVRSILGQVYPEFELILVNDGPDPGVSQAVSEVRSTNFRMIEFDGAEKRSPGKKEALKAGIEIADFDWLLLTDADCIVRPGWIQSMMSHASSKRRMVLGVAPFSRTGTFANLLARFDVVMIAMQYLGLARRQRAYMGVGRNVLYHKSLFKGTGGFSEHMEVASGDDDLFVQQASPLTQVAINLEPESIVYSPSKTTLKDFIGQKRRHVSTAGRYRLRDKFLIGLIGMSFIGFWLLGFVVLCTLSDVLLVLLGVGLLVQWAVFRIMAARLEASDLVASYLIMSPVYALFLIYFGLMAVFGKPKQEWS